MQSLPVWLSFRIAIGLAVGSVSVLCAQAPRPATVAGNAEEVIALPEFSVGSSSTDNSWVASSSMSGTRTNVPIQNLPRSIQVLTSEFLADIGADNMSDAAAFMTGVTSQGKQDAVFDNNTFTVRGMRQNRHYRDGVKEGFVGMINDNASVDRIEALRGPSSLLSGVVEPGGMINQISKSPRTKQETNVKVSVGSWEYLRTEVDVNLPVTPNLALRAVVAYQDTNGWRPWESSTRRVGFVAGSYRFSPSTIFNARAETIKYEGNVAISGPNIRIPTTATATSATAAPTFGSYAYGNVPEEILPWDFNPFGPNNRRTHEQFRVSGDVQHRFNDILSLRVATSWSNSDRRDLRLSGNATTIYTRFLNPALGSVAGNVVADEIRWAATKDDETWDIWSYSSDLRGKFAYLGLKHEAILGLERIESRNWRDRADTPNSTSTALGAAPSTNPNTLTRYKFPTAQSGALAANGFQPAWAEMTDLSRYTSPNSYVAQSVVRNAVSFTNVVSTTDERWHLLAGVRRDYGANTALTGTTNALATRAQLPYENATSGTVGLLYRPWKAFSVYASSSSSFSGVPTGIDVYGNLLNKPESGKSFEFGAKTSFLDGRLGFETAVYQLNRTNTRRQLTSTEIIAVLGFEPSGARSIQDNGEESRGIEAQVLYAPFRGYQISTNFSYSNATVVTPDIPLRNGTPISGRPRSNGSFFHKYTFQSGPLKDFSFNNAVVWVDGFRPGAVSGTTGQVLTFLDGYIRVDLGAGYRTKIMGRSVSFTATVRNVENKKIQEGLQSKGDPRSFRLGASTKF